MPGDYSFEKRSPGCSACGREFAVGEEYHSALVPAELAPAAEAEPESAPPEPADATGSEAPGKTEGGEVPAGGKDAGAEAPVCAPVATVESGLPFRRTDFCADCWDDERAGNYFSCWKASVPEEQDEEKRSLAKRIDVETTYDMFRRLEGHAGLPQQKFRFILALMLMRRKRLKFTGVVESPHGEHLVLDDRDEGISHKVLDPGLAEEEIDSLRAQIDLLLGGGEPEDAGESPAEAHPEVPPDGGAEPSR